VAKGARAKKRPAYAIGRAVMIGKIATGEIEDDRDEHSRATYASLCATGARRWALSTINVTPSFPPAGIEARWLCCA